jgi:flagellar biosynthesis chaperone FliJ
MLDAVQRERFDYEREWAERIAPAAVAVARCMRLQDQIETLEQIAREQHIPLDA